MKRTIPEFFRHAVDRSPEATWLVTDDGQYTYAEALARIEQAAAGLRARGVQHQDRVVVVARNSADYVLLWFALMDVGAIQVPVNPAATAPELTALAQQAEPTLVVADGEWLTTLEGSVDVADLFASAGDGAGPADLDPTDIAVMIPTSGTTGQSKLVMQTHLAYVMAGEGFPYWLGLTSDDRLMTSLPLFHINAPAYSILGSVAAGASVAVRPRFSARSFFEEARQVGATEFNSIGAMLEILMRQPPGPSDRDHSIRLCYTGPSPAPERHVEIEERFGFEITCGYALSESPYGLVWPRGSRLLGTLGVARQHPELGVINEARVVDADVDADDRPEVEFGEVGELELRNPVIMRGYYAMPDETAAVLVGGWLRTGDLVQRNADGTFTFVARKKEVIRRRGENLSPAEVEAVLEQHPAVVEAAVVAVPAEMSEDDVKAFVVVADGDSPFDPQAVRAFAAERLARFKLPRYVEVIAELPHTATGRIAKHRLPKGLTGAEVDLEERHG